MLGEPEPQIMMVTSGSDEARFCHAWAEIGPRSTIFSRKRWMRDDEIRQARFDD